MSPVKASTWTRFATSWKSRLLTSGTASLLPESASSLFLLPFLVAPFLIFLPFIHPRVEPLFYVAMTAVSGLMFWHVAKDRPNWWIIPVALAAYGAIIAPNWLEATVGLPSRSTGAFHWAIWGSLAMLWGPLLRNRWDGILWGLAVAGAVHGFLALLMPDSFAGRAVGVTANPGILAFWGMIGLVCVIWLARTAEIKSKPRLWVAVNALALGCILALGLAEARAALIGVAVALPFLAGRAGFLAIPVAALALLWAHPGADAQRIDMWRFVLENFSLIGHGFNTFAAAYPGQDFPHSLPLQLLWELGLVGWAAGAAFVVFGAFRLRGAWLAIFIAFTVYSLFWFPSPPWFFVGALLVARMRERHES